MEDKSNASTQVNQNNNLPLKDTTIPTQTQTNQIQKIPMMNNQTQLSNQKMKEKPHIVINQTEKTTTIIVQTNLKTRKDLPR